MGLFKQMKQAMSPEAIKQGMELSKQSMSSKSGLMPTAGDRDAVGRLRRCGERTRPRLQFRDPPRDLTARACTERAADVHNLAL